MMQVIAKPEEEEPARARQTAGLGRFSVIEFLVTGVVYASCLQRREKCGLSKTSIAHMQKWSDSHVPIILIGM